MISGFFGQHRWLSNFWPCQITGSNEVYPSAEHAYQAAKCADPEDRKLFCNGTAAEAKRRSKTLRVRADWNDVKLNVMRIILRKKFSKDSELAEKLLATGEEQLVEANTWGDRFWGVCGGTGENNLGKLLMQRRAELRAG